MGFDHDWADSAPDEDCLMTDWTYDLDEDMILEDVVDPAAFAQSTEFELLEPSAPAVFTSQPRPLTQGIPFSKQKTTCQVCGLVILKKTLPRHVRVKHHQQRQLLPCSYCDRTFSRMDIVERHEREQHGEDIGTVECVYCGQDIRQRAIKDHFRSRKCREARASPKELERDSPSCRAQSGTSVFQGLGVEAAMDSILVCSYFLVNAALLRIALNAKLEISQDDALPLNTTHVPRQIHVELWELRGLAIRLTRKRLANIYAHDSAIAEVFSLALADLDIFGEQSEYCEAHIKHLESNKRSLNRLQEAGERMDGAAKATFDNAWRNALSKGLPLEDWYLRDFEKERLEYVDGFYEVFEVPR